MHTSEITNHTSESESEAEFIQRSKMRGQSRSQRSTSENQSLELELEAGVMLVSLPPSRSRSYSRKASCNGSQSTKMEDPAVQPDRAQCVEYAMRQLSALFGPEQ